MRAALLLLALAAIPAAAQEPPSPSPALALSVDEAVTRAIAASPRLARLGAQEAAAEAQRRGAAAERALWFPTTRSSCGAPIRLSSLPEGRWVAPRGLCSVPVRP